jgi:hypothetical protein
VSIKICGFSSSVDQHTLQDMKDSFQTRVWRLLDQPSHQFCQYDTLGWLLIGAYEELCLWMEIINGSRANGSIFWCHSADQKIWHHALQSHYDFFKGNMYLPKRWWWPILAIIVISYCINKNGKTVNLPKRKMAILSNDCNKLLLQ